MRIAVMAAGAVGGYFGARLAQAGHEVALASRPLLGASTAISPPPSPSPGYILSIYSEGRAAESAR